MVYVSNCIICGCPRFGVDSRLCGNCDILFSKRIIAALEKKVGKTDFLKIKEEVLEEMLKNPPKREKQNARY